MTAVQRGGALLTACFVLACGLAADPPKSASRPVELNLEDQFGRKQDLAAFRGEVVALVYGDRGAADASREFADKLHVLFHPSASGMPAAKARGAPVAPLEGVAPGKRSPDVVVIPAVAGGGPDVVKDWYRIQTRRASPDVPVWLDFAGTLTEKFGLREGQTNLAIFDATGRLRMKINGTPDTALVEKLLQTLQDLRAEAAGLGK